MFLSCKHYKGIFFGFTKKQTHKFSFAFERLPSLALSVYKCFKTTMSGISNLIPVSDTLSLPELKNLSLLMILMENIKGIVQCLLPLKTKHFQRNNITSNAHSLNVITIRRNYMICSITLLLCIFYNNLLKVIEYLSFIS